MQGVLYVCNADVIQEQIALVAEHILGNEKGVSQLLALQLGNQISPGDQTADGNGLTEEVVHDGVYVHPQGGEPRHGKGGKMLHVRFGQHTRSDGEMTGDVHRLAIRQSVLKLHGVKA